MNQQDSRAKALEAVMWKADRGRKIGSKDGCKQRFAG
jgi:hypothetical protein